MVGRAWQSQVRESVFSMRTINCPDCWELKVREKRFPLLDPTSVLMLIGFQYFNLPSLSEINNESSTDCRAHFMFKLVIKPIYIKKIRIIHFSLALYSDSKHSCIQIELQVWTKYVFSKVIDPCPVVDSNVEEKKNGEDRKRYNKKPSQSLYNLQNAIKDMTIF